MLSHFASQLWDFLPPPTTKRIVEEIEVKRGLLAVLMLVLLLALQDITRIGAFSATNTEENEKVSATKHSHSHETCLTPASITHD